MGRRVCGRFVIRARAVHVYFSLSHFLFRSFSLSDLILCLVLLPMVGEWRLWSRARQLRRQSRQRHRRLVRDGRAGHGGAKWSVATPEQSTALACGAPPARPPWTTRAPPWEQEHTTITTMGRRAAAAGSPPGSAASCSRHWRPAKDAKLRALVTLYGPQN